MRYRFDIVVLLSLTALLGAPSSTLAGQHAYERFEDLLKDRNYCCDPILTRLKEKEEYASTVKYFEENFKPNENVLCYFDIDVTGHIKNLRTDITSNKNKGITQNEKKLFALIGKAVPFYRPTPEMIKNGVQLEFWKDARDAKKPIEVVAKSIVPPKVPVVKGDSFRDLLKKREY